MPGASYSKAPHVGGSEKLREGVDGCSSWVRIRVVYFLSFFSDQDNMSVFWFLDMGRVTPLLKWCPVPCVRDMGAHLYSSF